MSDATIASAPRADTPRVHYLGWRAAERPQPAFAHVLGAVSGAFAVVAMVAFVIAASDANAQVEGIIGSLLLMAIAIGIGIPEIGPVRSAATTALVLTVPILWVFALFAGGGLPDRGDVRLFLILSALSYAVLYLITWTRGRAVLLAGALLLFVVWIGWEFAGSGGTSNSVFGSSGLNNPISGGSVGSAPFGTTSGSGIDTDSMYAAVMIVGFVYLLVGGLLDRWKLRGTATPFVAIGGVSAIIGGIGLASGESQLATGIVAVLIGAAVGVIAAAGRERRATTWIGVFTVFYGAMVILTEIDPDSPEGVGAVALAIAVITGALAWGLLGGAARTPRPRRHARGTHADRRSARGRCCRPDTRGRG